MKPPTQMRKKSDVAIPAENLLAFLREWADGFEAGQIFLTALELDVFSELVRPSRADELAAKLGIHTELTDKLLNVLVGMKMLERTKEGYRTASTVAPYLAKDSPRFARYLNHCIQIRESISHLKNFLYAGPKLLPESEPHSITVDDMDWRERISMAVHHDDVMRHIKTMPEFQKARTLMDLGSGNGRFAIAFALENHSLKVVVFDRPYFIDSTRDNIEKYGLSKRVQTMAGDFMCDDVGTGYDIVFEACAFDGDDVDFRLFTRKISSSLNIGGLFICLTFSIDDDRNGPLLPLIWNLKNYLTGSGHRLIRSNAAIVQMLTWAGLEIKEIIDMSSWCNTPVRLFITRKVSRI
mgnify:CR=1 FL=1